MNAQRPPQLPQPAQPPRPPMPGNQARQTAAQQAQALTRQRKAQQMNPNNLRQQQMDIALWQAGLPSQTFARNYMRR